MERNNQSGVLETGSTVGDKITKTADRVLEPLRTHRVDRDLDAHDLLDAGNRVNEVRDKVNREDVDLSDTDVTYEEAAESLRRMTTGLTSNLARSGNNSLMRMETNGYSFKEEGRKVQTDDAIEASNYLADEASDQEIVEAAAAYADGTSLDMEYNQDREPGTGGLNEGGSFDTEAERAMDILLQHDTYERRQ